VRTGRLHPRLAFGGNSTPFPLREAGISVGLAELTNLVAGVFRLYPERKMINLNEQGSTCPAKRDQDMEDKLLIPRVNKNRGGLRPNGVPKSLSLFGRECVSGFSSIGPSDGDALSILRRGRTYSVPLRTLGRDRAVETCAGVCPGKPYLKASVPRP
jgi:hypothetical protein